MRLIFFVFFIFFSYTSITIAAFRTDPIAEAQQEELARHPVWLKLLHFDKAGRRSEIRNDEFFLAPDGRNDPKAELLATINAYFEPWSETPDIHPRCQFPARFFWLSQFVVFPDYTFRLPQCKRLEKWALFDDKKSVSLLLVSGYLGNPASTFGHALLKLNNKAYDDPVDLLNVTINYGAIIPPHEPIWRFKP